MTVCHSDVLHLTGHCVALGQAAFARDMLLLLALFMAAYWVAAKLEAAGAEQSEAEDGR